MRIAGVVALCALALLVAYVAGALLGLYGEHSGPGAVTAQAIPAEVVAQRAAAQSDLLRAIDAPDAKPVLFGDLHVHTTFSTDAFLAQPARDEGDGAHPPADACDFARFCSALDFWSINDHAEAITPRTGARRRSRSASATRSPATPTNPDVVAFLGWEWTQVGRTPEEHYGHKNVILRETAEDRVPTRPISAGGFTRQVMAALPLSAAARCPRCSTSANRQRYFDFGASPGARATPPPARRAST